MLCVVVTNLEIIDSKAREPHHTQDCVLASVYLGVIKDQTWP